MKNMAQLVSSVSSVFAPLWKGKASCFGGKRSKRMKSVNNKISCSLKTVVDAANPSVGDVGLKKALSFDIYVRENTRDFETSRKILRRVDVAAVVVDSDNNNAKEKFAEVSSSSCPSDCGNSDSNSGVKSSLPSAVNSKDSSCFRVHEVSPISSPSDCDSKINVKSSGVSSAVAYKRSPGSEALSANYLALLECIPLRIYRPDTDIPVSPSQDVEWTMMKILTANDCNSQHRLLVWKKLVEDHILPHLDEASRQVIVNTVCGLRIDVLDCDMDIEFELTLKKWPSTQCYGLTDNWKRDFAERRGLNLGDEIGLRWDKQHNRLQFTVLRRSPLTDYLAKLR